MQQCSETITVLNRWYNRATDLDEWIPTVIHGVSWFNKVAATVTTAGLKTADTATVRIPVDADTGGRSYMPPPAFKAAESPSGAYTLARGDYIARGDITTTVNGVVQPITPAQAQAATEDFITILSVTDSTHRPNAPHRKVVGA